MTGARPTSVPALLFATSTGEILDYAGLSMAGSAAGRIRAPEPEDLIELPPGSELFALPGRLPIGIEPESGDAALLDTNPYQPGEPIQAVAAFMAPAHTAILSAAYQTDGANAPLLPLFAYTAVGWADGTFWVAGFRSDADRRQDADQFNQRLLNRRTRAHLHRHRNNRLIQHLGTCCLTYGCPAARNYFLGRWEAPLPCSPICNAACAGCISLQPSGCCPSTQDRITFVPTEKEIAEVAVPHLKTAPRPVVSFGQGCEGEPLLQAGLIEKSIRLIRSRTDRGTINLNTNGSLPDAVERLARAGLDSIRISLNSAQAERHRLYYRPKGFTLADVCRSMAVMKRYGRHVSLNYFILPGCTDDPDEFAALSALITEYRPDFIQLRNLNMDPEYYLRVIGHRADTPPLGIRNWLGQLKEKFPELGFGYYNPPLR
ncbi:radical SAM protein [Desulfobulbus elongatus]|uniref:radical SAM protein n=1 Tax=Desulfobulbus elongatus TaxID=53332 RepID=UPI000487A9A3|nr:radical SAM protein [Desulfobulbus elongatus]